MQPRDASERIGKLKYSFSTREPNKVRKQCFLANLVTARQNKNKNNSRISLQHQ